MMDYASNIQQYLQKHGFEAFHPKAVLFDMDGVLFDSMPLHAVSWHECAELRQSDCLPDSNGNGS